jgi:hypothetical protein
VTSGIERHHIAQESGVRLETDVHEHACDLFRMQSARRDHGLLAKDLRDDRPQHIRRHPFIEQPRGAGHAQLAQSEAGSCGRPQGLIGSPDYAIIAFFLRRYQ